MERLYRSRTDRVFTGVAAALARALRVRPAIVRVLFVLLALASGVGLVLYALGTLLLPQEGTRAQRYGDVLRENARSSLSETSAAWRAFGRWAREWQYRRTRGPAEIRYPELLGAGLVTLGLLWLLASLGLFAWLTFGRFLAILVVGAGVAVLVASASR